MTDCFLYPRFEKVGGILLYICPSFCPSVRPYVIPLHFIVKDFPTTLQARKVIFSIQIYDDMLYRGIANQPSPASLYLSDFLSFHTLNDEIFRQRFLCVQAWVVIFGMQVGNDVLYCGIANQPSDAYSSLYLSVLLSFHTLKNEIFVKYFCEIVQASHTYLVSRLIMIYYIVGLRTNLLILNLPCICFLFFRTEIMICCCCCCIVVLRPR